MRSKAAVRSRFLSYTGCMGMILVLSCFLISSCGVRRIVDQITMAQSLGYDLDGKRVRSTLLFGDYSEKEKTNIKILSAESISSMDTFQLLNTKSKHSIHAGQMGLVIFGKEYAKQGIGSVMTRLFKEPYISSQLQLAVAGTNAAELLSSTVKTHDTSFIMNMIEQSEQWGNLPKVNLQTSLYNYYGAGRDLFLPYFIMEGGTVKIDGIALFKDDKFVTNVDIRDAFVLKLLTENARNGSILMPLKKSGSLPDDYILMKSITSKRTFQLVSREPSPAILIKIKMKVSVRDKPEYLRLESKEELSAFEQKLTAYLVKKSEAFISLCKSKQIDPIGLGDFVRSKSRRWNERDFQSSYPSLKTVIRIDLTIVQTSLAE
ncbi:Ger(x)C family spore germination protein [Paenibacillus albus]|uniref:Ger(X)C family spore germination protein n=1 Tax=Paenibacillus albus TaxID=2495582 RepID=A0A3S9A1W8_9BACL|nr:Ger(x)C family spore germination protein [Paenibacillus albus]AZN39753.1 Ger(x)C family spore germination protein [Paenibacillus albus]